LEGLPASHIAKEHRRNLQGSDLTIEKLRLTAGHPDLVLEHIGRRRMALGGYQEKKQCIHIQVIMVGVG
jgi:hypothetical protein